MNLVVVESPTKARTLSRFLGENYAVEATMGHIMDLPKSRLGIDVENNFTPSYVAVNKSKDAVTKIIDGAKKANQVYLATDPDREGEAIASHVAELLSYKVTKLQSNLKRIVFHEITKEAVEGAIGHPREIDKNLVDAQTARRVLDRLVGYELSPLLWRKVRRGLSAGRVQTIAVRLIVEREKEIEKFKSEEYWEIYVKVSKVSKVSNAFVVKLVKIGDKKAEVKNKEVADKIVTDLEKAKYQVSDVKKREVVKGPHPPFTTSTMTQGCARLFFWSAKKTMSLAQRLYEEGLITYHRTDSTFISGVAVGKVREFIKKSYGDKYLPESPRLFKTTSKVAQEAHEAIRPTDVARYQILDTRYQKDAMRLYDLIWRRFVACQMAASVYDETTIDVIARSKIPDTSYQLRASGQMMKFDGWRAAYGGTEDEEPKLPEVKKGEPLQLVKVDPRQKFTEPPPRYNEASLIKTLEKLGIGRPSTYAPIITTIQVRQYVEKEEGKFIPTPVGFAVNDFLVKYFPDVFDYKFTAEMEDNLDHVANGKVAWQKPIKNFWEPFDKKLETVTKKSKRIKIETEKLGRDCPQCVKEGLPRDGVLRGELVIRIGRFGKFIACSRFPDCKYTEKYVEKVGIKCPECIRRGLPAGRQGDVIVKKSSKGRMFYGCSRYPDCKWASWRNPAQPKTGT